MHINSASSGSCRDGLRTREQEFLDLIYADEELLRAEFNDHRR
jgi:hypothetical protein